MPPNPFLLAADNDPSLLPLLRANPALASAQDAHGYSLLHAAASYNHLDLLRALVRDFNVPVDLRDEDDETALFVVETVEAARMLVEELGLDPTIKSGEDGLTARERIEAEGDFPDVARYLATAAGRSRAAAAGGDTGGSSTAGESSSDAAAPLGRVPPVPNGLDVSIGTMVEPDVAAAEVVDPEFRRRIEQLAAREDFHSAAGQAELRRLVEAAVTGRISPRTGMCGHVTGDSYLR